MRFKRIESLDSSNKKIAFKLLVSNFVGKIYEEFQKEQRNIYRAFEHSSS